MMATAAGATLSTPLALAAAVAAGGGSGSDSPVPVWTAQVQQVVASSTSSSSLDCSSSSSNRRMSSSSCSSSSTAGGVVGGLNPELCWQMVESGQTAQRRRRHVQRLFHQGRALLVKHLPRDVNEHVSTSSYLLHSSSISSLLTTKLCQCVCVNDVFASVSFSCVQSNVYSSLLLLSSFLALFWRHKGVSSQPSLPPPFHSQLSV